MGIKNKQLETQPPMSLLIQGLPFLIHANASRILLEQRLDPKRSGTTPPLFPC
jgi:hypothetical protein